MSHIFITGANRGIGLELSRQHVSRGDFVFATCRQPGQAQALQSLRDRYPDRLQIFRLEVTDEEGLPEVTSQVHQRTEHLDVLYNNAAIFKRGESPGSLTAQSLLHVFHVNAVAPVVIAQSLLPLLRRGQHPRILNISSQMGSLARKRSGGSYSYCSSKAALNMLTRTLAADLRRDGIVVVTVHPGWVQTDMGGRGADVTPQASAQGLIALSDRLTLTDSGEFFTWRGNKHPW